MKKKIILVTGDPNSINSEIIYKCWIKLPNQLKKNIYLVSNYKLLKDQFTKLKYKIGLIKVKNIFDVSNNKLKILDIDLNYTNSFKISINSSSKFVLKSLNLAHKLGLNKNVAGIINCPIDKRLLKKKIIGVTEYLAKKCGVRDNSEVMIIKNKKLAVSPITTHLNIKNIPYKINKKIILKKIKTMHNWYFKKYNKKPRMAILGLNPHNAELKKDSKEKKIIIPAIKSLKNLGVKIDGPHSADTIFISDYTSYDIIVGMYHDQILAPFKAIFKFDAINLTLGLKYTRVSPDHGVARNRILKKNSNFLSLLNCIYYIHKSNL